MFSQKSIDEMSIEQLVSLVRSLAHSIENRIDDPADAYDYCNALSNVTDNLRDRIEAVLED
jgi:hypothetical protein